MVSRTALSGSPTCPVFGTWTYVCLNDTPDDSIVASPKLQDPSGSSTGNATGVRLGRVDGDILVETCCFQIAMTPRRKEPFTPWTDAVRRAIEASPSIRALAKASDISPGELWRIANGGRSATRRVAVAVAAALSRIAAEQARSSKKCAQCATTLREALRGAE